MGRSVTIFALAKRKKARARVACVYVHVSVVMYHVLVLCMSLKVFFVHMSLHRFFVIQLESTSICRSRSSNSNINSNTNATATAAEVANRVKTSLWQHLMLMLMSAATFPHGHVSTSADCQGATCAANSLEMEGRATSASAYQTTASVCRPARTK